MKFVVNGSELSEAVSKVVKAVSTKTTNPILEGIKLKVTGDELSFLATDTEISIEKTIIASTFTEGETVVPGKMFAEFVKKIENEDEIEFTFLDNQLKINYGSSEGFIQTFPAEEFPIINKDIKEKFFSIKQKELKELILKSSFACSQDEARPLLKGCLLEIEDDEITSVALDGFRLALYRKKIIEKSENFKIIVNARTLNEIVRILENDEDVVTIIVQKNVLMCEVNGTILISRLLEGEYIDYRNIIKEDYLTLVKVNKNQFLTAIDRASALNTDVKKIVKLDIKENYMSVSSSSEAGKMNENVIINLEGKDLTISFNAKFIIDSIKAIDDEFINLYFNNKINPCVIKPYSGNDYLYLIVPLRINA
ncbi:MAG: DNA polymerase III subunit beta [Clostridia bacterium]|nr:DNA polymerase III subunit beta [Clostridia bacterium]